MTQKQPNLAEIEAFMQENKPSQNLDNDTLSRLMAENSTLFHQYSKDRQFNNSNDLLPSAYF